MKKIFQLFILAIIAINFLACREDEPVNASTTGEIDLSSLTVSYNHNATIVRSTDVNDFIISIYEKGGSTSLTQWSYKDMPEVFTLDAGIYTLQVASHIPEAAAWDLPYYFAQKDFEIEVEKVTAIGEVVCELSNVKVTVEFSSDLLAVMGNDCKVNVALGKGSLDFTKDEGRAGYFTINEENENRLYAYFTGTVDGYVDTTYREIDNVKAGEWRILRYSLKQNTEPNIESGSFTPQLIIDVTCQTIEQNHQIDVKEDVIEDPEGNDGGNETPGPIDPPTPNQGPKITATAFDINEPQILTDDLVIKVEVTSESPLAGFTVDIESTTLTPEELEAVGLSAHLDLGNPGDLRPQLEGLGFPVAENVIGANEISFDITQFGGLLAALGSGTHSFVMTATDQANNVTIQTLTLITQ